jgi:hypothetical protein
MPQPPENKHPMQQLADGLGRRLEEGKLALAGAWHALQDRLPKPEAASCSYSCSLSASAPMIASISSQSAPVWHPGPGPGHAASAARKAELGRATWTLVHTLASQYPESPSRQQQREVATFLSTLARVYPCGTCASHFQEIIKWV